MLNGEMPTLCFGDYSSGESERDILTPEVEDLSSDDGEAFQALWDRGGDEALDMLTSGREVVASRYRVYPGEHSVSGYVMRQLMEVSSFWEEHNEICDEADPIMVREGDSRSGHQLVIVLEPQELPYMVGHDDDRRLGWRRPPQDAWRRRQDLPASYRERTDRVVVGRLLGDYRTFVIPVRNLVRRYVAAAYDPVQVEARAAWRDNHAGSSRHILLDYVTGQVEAHVRVMDTPHDVVSWPAWFLFSQAALIRNTPHRPHAMLVTQFQDAPWRYTMMGSEGFLAQAPTGYSSLRHACGG